MQGISKKAIYMAGGVMPLVALLSDAKPHTAANAASALWGLADGKEGIFDRDIVMAGAVPKLVEMLHTNESETRGFAAACLLCLCKDSGARAAILASGGVEPLVGLALGPATWLRTQVIQMLKLLHVPVPDEDGSYDSKLVGDSKEVGAALPAEIVPRKGVYVSRAKLKIRAECALDSNDLGDLPMGSQVKIGERAELADGTKRCAIIKDGEEKAAGWVSIVGKDGEDNLLDSGDPNTANSIAALVRSMAALGPQTLKLDALSEHARSLLTHAGGGTFTARMKYHFWSFQIPTNRNSEAV